MTTPTTARDPRTDPQKGDVVYRKLYYTVADRDTGSVRVLTTGQRRGKWWTLERWNAFVSHRDTDVVKVARPPRPRKPRANTAPDRVDLGPAEMEIVRQVMDPNNPKGKRRRHMTTRPARPRKGGR